MDVVTHVAASGARRCCCSRCTSNHHHRSLPLLPHLVLRSAHDVSTAATVTSTSVCQQFPSSRRDARIQQTSANVTARNCSDNNICHAPQVSAGVTCGEHKVCDCVHWLLQIDNVDVKSPFCVQSVRNFIYCQQQNGKEHV